MALGHDALTQLRHLLRPLSNRIANSIARAVVQVVDDNTKQQLLQIGVLAGEDIDEAERFQEYGFSSVPLAGAEAVVLFPNGDRAHPLVVAVDDRRYRVTGLQRGEVAVYSKFGALIKLTKDGDIEVVPAPGGEVRIGGAGVSDPVARASDLDAIKAAINAGTPVAHDGGASLKTTILAAWPSSVGSTKVKVE